MTGGGLAATFNEQGHGWFDDADRSQAIRAGDRGGGGAARESTLLVVPPLNSGMGKRRGSGAHGDAMIPAVANPLTARMHKGVNTTGDEGQTMIPVMMSADLRNGTVDANVAQTIQSAGIGAERGGDPNTVPHVVAFDWQATRQSGDEERTGTLRSQHSGSLAVAASTASPLMAQANNTGGNRPPGMCADSAAGQLVALFKPSHFTRGKDGAPDDLSPPLSADADKGDQNPVLMAGAAVRRLTPRECERLQNFPDDYTLITYRGKPAADGPRYRALGNSMNVADIGPILRRIDLFEKTRGQT